MADQTGVEWTDATWNPVAGCSIVSPGCTNCYAMRVAARLATMPQAKYQDLTQPSKAGPVWTGRIALGDLATLSIPLRWKKPRRIFVNSMSDLFHEAVPDAFIDGVFAVAAMATQHTFQILTKRADRMRDYSRRRAKDWAEHLPQAALAHVHAAGLRATMPSEMRLGWPLPNVWLGVSVENQKFADARIPLLLDTPAALRWISAEPLLGPITIPPGLDWVVVGGESGPDARPMHPDWARAIRDQCAAAGVPFFFKQWGEWLDEMVATVSGHAPGPSMFDAQRMPRGDRWHFYDPDDRLGGAMIRIGKKAAGHLLDGVEHREFPR